MNSSLYLRRFFVMFLGLGLPLAPYAQQVPGAAQPGQIERQFQQTPPVTAPREIQTPPIDKALQPAEADTLKFVLKSLSIDGSKVYLPEQLLPDYEGLIGKTISLSDLYRVAERMTVRYRNDGYILSAVSVPPQKITDGNARLQATEGFVEKVSVQGNVKGPREHIESLAQKITSQRPLTAAVLERYLLLINDLTGVTAQSVLKLSAPGPGAELIVSIGQRQFDGAVELNNRGGPSVGPVRLEGELTAHSLMGGFSQLRGFASTTLNEELRFASLQAESPIGTEGAVVSVSLSGSGAKPDIARTQGVKFETSAVGVNIAAKYPIVRARARNLSARAVLSGLNGRTEANGALLSDDRLRSIRVGVNFDVADQWVGVSYVDFELSQGLDGFGARKTGSDNLSRSTGRSDFTKFNLSAARLQEISGPWSALVSFSGQKSYSDLLVPEQFGFGGAILGRGYDAAELLGDSGAGAKLELRYSGNLDSAIRSYVAYGFFDAGKVFRRNAVNQPGSVSATSTGLGVRVGMVSNLSAYVELAKPLTRDVVSQGNRDVRAYAGLRWAF